MNDNSVISLAEQARERGREQWRKRKSANAGLRKWLEPFTLKPRDAAASALRGWVKATTDRLGPEVTVELLEFELSAAKAARAE